MKKSMKTYSKLIWGLLFIFFLAGCSPCGLFRGRPDIYSTYEEWIYDYNDLCPPVEEEIVSEEKEPLTQELFDPYRPLDSEYHLGVGDILALEVFEDTEILVENAMIAPDGYIYYSVLEGVPAAGRTLNEVKEDVQVKLKGMIIEPKLTIIPKETLGQSFKILGRIQSPGVYPIVGSMRLTEAIGMAGGFYSQGTKDEQDHSLLVPLQDLDQSFIARGDVKLDVDFERLMRKGDATQNIYVRPGDYIYIAPYEKRAVYVLGAVNTPRRVVYSPTLTLTGALSAATGWPSPFWDSPNLSKVLVVRGSVDCPCVIQVDLKKVLYGKARDVVLMPGDIVYAQHKPMRFGRELVRLAFDAFFHAFGVSAAGHFSEIHWGLGKFGTSTDTGG